MIATSRRGFITGLIAFAAAPAIVRAESLMPVKALPFAEPSALARAMQQYIEKMVNPPLSAAYQDFVLFGTGAMEFDGTQVRHIPLKQLHVDRLEVIKMTGPFPGMTD